VREEPLTAGELAGFEKRLAYARDNLHLEAIFPFASHDAPAVPRLGGIVESPKNPLDQEFEQELQRLFASYQGMVIPHR
jgi:hypothetical protein